MRRLNVESAELPPVQLNAIELTGVDEEGAPVELVDVRAERFELHEHVSEPYSLMLAVSVADKELFVPGLVGGRGMLDIVRTTRERSLHGVIFKAETVGVVHGRLRLRLWIAPSLEVLRLSKRTRIFQGLTAVEIVEKVVAEAFETHGGELDVSQLGEFLFTIRDYCVQFEETDLEFVQRLLAEEGISFTFVHDGPQETMLLLGSGAIAHSAAGESELFPADVLVRPPSVVDEEAVHSLEGSTAMRAASTSASMRDWKVNPPVTNFGTEDPISFDDKLPALLGRFGEAYVHEPYRPVEEEEGGPLVLSVDGEASLQAHRHRIEDVRARGSGNVLGFTDCATFEIHDHLTADLHGFYALLSVSHIAEFSGTLVDGKKRGASVYTNRFTCFRFGQRDDDDGTFNYHYVPHRKPKPRAPGPVTATVIGPEGEEIYTDEHGRIRVVMHFDRRTSEEVDDSERSCWVPVSQTFAGPGYGTVFIPRVGMEVVINFIAGDPDRPLCGGVVYNGANTPPYPLPDQRTRSVIKTSSTPGGDGFNELSFEDAAGNEEIFLHAQKNLREVVKASHTTSVGGSQSDSVGGDQSVSVSGNQTNTVKKDQTENVTGNVTVNVTGERCTSITGKETLTLFDDRITTVIKNEFHSVTLNRTECVTGGRDTIIGTYDKETVTSGDKSVAVDAGKYGLLAKTAVTLSQAEEHTLALEEGAVLSTSKDFSVSNGSTSVASEGGVLTLSAAEELQLKCGSAEIVLKSDGTITIHGPAGVSVTSAGGEFHAKPAETSVSGPKVGVRADGVMELQGALIKIN